MWVVYGVGFVTAKPVRAFDNYSDAYEYAREIRMSHFWGVDIRKTTAKEVSKLTKGIPL